MGLATLSLLASALPQAVFAEEGKGTEMKEVHAVAKLEKLDDSLDNFAKGLRDDDSKWGGTQESVIIRPSGEFRLTGVHVNSVDSVGMMLSGGLYGFSKDVSVAGAELHARNGRVLSLGDIKVGDKLIVRGNWDRTSHVITVKYIRDVSVVNDPAASAKIQSRIDELLKMIAALQAKLHGRTP